uniref:Uncharacterized protein n=1 Tax=Triticum urartu TaxID=4572 RepID=A0A8R7U0K2_TRIUA
MASASPVFTRRDSTSSASRRDTTGLNWNGTSSRSASLVSAMAVCESRSLCSCTAVRRKCGGPSGRAARRWSSSSHCVASAPPRSMTWTIFSDSMASRIAWFAAAPARRRKGQRSRKWRRATATSAGVGPARGNSSARHRPGHARSARRASASAKAAATRCMASPSGAARVAMCSSAALAASSRPAEAAAAQLSRRWMRQRPRSSERSSRSIQGGVAPAPGCGWSGMLEKFWSGEEVTDEEEPSSWWTISLASAAARSARRSRSVHEASKQSRLL